MYPQFGEETYKEPQHLSPTAPTVPIIQQENVNPYFNPMNMNQQQHLANQPHLYTPMMYQTPLNQNTNVQRQPWFNYIFLTINGYVLAFDHTSKTLVWKTTLKGVGWNQTSVVCETLMDGNGKIYVTAGKVLHCLDAKTGNIIWKQSINGKWCYLKVEPEALFIATNGYLHSVDKISGKIFWTASLSGFGYNVTSMLVAPNIIYVAANGKVRALMRSNGQLLDWKNDLSGKRYFEVTLALHDNVVTAGTFGSIVALNLPNAVTARDTRFYTYSYSIVSLMWRGSDMLIVGTDAGVVACHPLTHNVIWKNELKGCGYTFGVSLAQTEQRIYVGINGYVVCLDPNTGNTLWRTGLPGTGFGSQFVAMFIKDHILYAGCNGLIFGLDALGGTILWKDGLKGCGYGNVQICDYVNYIDLNAQPQLHVIMAVARKRAQNATR